MKMLSPRSAKPTPGCPNLWSRNRRSAAGTSVPLRADNRSAGHRLKACGRADLVGAWAIERLVLGSRRLRRVSLQEGEDHGRPDARYLLRPRQSDERLEQQSVYGRLAEDRRADKAPQGCPLSVRALVR